MKVCFDMRVKFMRKPSNIIREEEEKCKHY